MVAKHKNTRYNWHMESTSKHNPSVLRESTSKHDPPLARVYEWFLELPVPIVLAVMWLAGTALISVCGLALYSLLLVVATEGSG
jgi:bacteriorhodopsin